MSHEQAAQAAARYATVRHLDHAAAAKALGISAATVQGYRRTHPDLAPKAATPDAAPERALPPGIKRVYVRAGDWPVNSTAEWRAAPVSRSRAPWE